MEEKTCGGCYLSEAADVICSDDDRFLVCRKGGGKSMPIDADTPACEDYVDAVQRRREQQEREAFDATIYPIVDAFFQEHYQKKTFTEYREMAREHLSPPLKDVTLGAWEFNSLLNIIFYCFRRSKQLGVEIWKEEE